MSEMKRLFVVSDIHGHCTLLREALNGAGFDADCEDHILICCGDLFDRGRENRAVYDFIRGLKHKVLIRGNHDERLADILAAKRADLYDLHNGMEVTLEEFFGLGSVGEYGELYLPKYGKMAGKLRALVNGMLDYYETERYIFVHGWLPIRLDEKPPRLLEDWRSADETAWRAARFSEWTALYGTPAVPRDKTLVCGHRPTRLAFRVDPARSATDSSIFYGKGMIAIDAGTVRSGRVNLLVLEDRLLPNPHA